jgi:hypothetical protein
MRAICIGVAFSIFAFIAAAAQSPVASSPQALQILRQSLAALSPHIAVQDVTLSGSVHHIAGSDDETGTAELKATALGDARIDLSFASGTHSEIYNLSSASPAGQWSDRDHPRQEIPLHNLLSEPAWFSPVTSISRRINAAAFTASYLGAETLDSLNVHHIAVTQLPPKFTTDPQLHQHLTQVDLYIDPSTFLPVALSFNLHPDENALSDIPVEIRYSDYRLVKGQQIPFHIQKFFNNTLQLDIQLDSATVNTGVPSTTFGVS